jgi:stage II sporulation protein D
MRGGEGGAWAAGRRAASAVGIALLVSCATAGAPPVGSDGPQIRVLLSDGREAVVADGREIRQEARLRGPGPHEVDGRRVRGTVEILRGANGLRVVNELPLEDYVAGTVLGEVPEEWGPALLRAQAVAIRTYALHRRATAGRRDYHVEADTRAQQYVGLDGETPAVRDAVADTRFQILTFDGAPILAAYHATAGGRTATAEEVWGRDVPYLRSVAVSGEDPSPDTYWRTRFTPAEIGAAAAKLGRDVGAVRDVVVLAHSPSGRALEVRVRGTRDVALLDAAKLRRALGPARLHSMLFDVRRTGDEFVFVGSGRGHGVGMSQWGARALASQGASHEQILARFYPGARLERATRASFAAPVGAAP